MNGDKEQNNLCFTVLGMFFFFWFCSFLLEVCKQLFATIPRVELSVFRGISLSEFLGLSHFWAWTTLVVNLSKLVAFLANSLDQK